jgi:hypothetical protein
LRQHELPQLLLRKRDDQLTHATHAAASSARRNQ